MNDLRVPLRATYDADANAAYIHFQSEIGAGGVTRTVCVDPLAIGGMVNLDLNDQGQVLGIEVLDARSLLPDELLRALGADA